jgi:hypothetical protein
MYIVSEKKELIRFNNQKTTKNLKKLLLKYFHNLKKKENKIKKTEDSESRISGIAGPEITEIGTKYINIEKKVENLLILSFIIKRLLILLLPISLSDLIKYRFN